MKNKVGIIILIVVAIIIVILLAIIFYRAIIKPNDKDAEIIETPEETEDPEKYEWDYIERQDEDINLTNDRYINHIINIKVNEMNISIGNDKEANGICLTPHINTESYYVIMCEVNNGDLMSNDSSYYDIINYNKNTHLYLKDTKEWKFKELNDSNELYWIAYTLDEFKNSEVYLRFFNLETCNIDFILQINIEKNNSDKYYVKSIDNINLLKKEDIQILNEKLKNSSVARLKYINTDGYVIETLVKNLCLFESRSPNHSSKISIMDIDYNKLPLRMFTINEKDGLENIYLDNNNEIVAYDLVTMTDIMMETLSNTPGYTEEYRDLAIYYGVISEDDNVLSNDIIEEPGYQPDPEQIQSEWEYMQEQIRKDLEEPEKDQTYQEEEPGEEPGEETGEEPGEETGEEPGEETGEEPGEETGEEPGDVEIP